MSTENREQPSNAETSLSTIAQMLPSIDKWADRIGKWGTAIMVLTTALGGIAYVLRPHLSLIVPVASCFLSGTMTRYVGRHLPSARTIIVTSIFTPFMIMVSIVGMIVHYRLDVVSPQWNFPLAAWGISLWLWLPVLVAVQAHLLVQLVGTVREMANLGKTTVGLVRHVHERQVVLAREVFDEPDSESEQRTSP